MKKALLSIFSIFAFLVTVNAQVLYDNGPIVNAPGGGFGGADLSHLHSGLTTWGAGHALSTGFRVADEFTVPAGTTWNLDSIVFHAYQTGSGLTSTINHVNFAIWNGSPDMSTSSIIAGDTSTNRLINTTWSNIYRTNSTDFMNTDRPLMRNTTDASGIVLPSGTYWLAWQTGGTATSGPWVPEITITNQPVTGNALQYSPTTGLWSPLLDQNNPQGMPFIVYGTSITAVDELYMNGKVNVFPNPFTTSTYFSIDKTVVAGNSELAIHITNALGQTVHSITNITSQYVEFNRNELKNGIYFYELRNNEQVISIGKIMIN